MIEVRKVNVATLRYRGADLLKEYAEERVISGLGVPSPDWPLYALVEGSGCYSVFNVEVDGELVGFAGLLHAVSPHNGWLMANVESLFVRKQQRGSMAAARLMFAVEEFAKKAGCRAIIYSAPAGGQLEAALDKRMPRTNSVFCKPLG